MMQPTVRSLVIGLLASSASVALAQVAPQTTSTGQMLATATDDGLTDIVVTAQRRSESAQRVPIAITTFDALQVQNLNAVSPLDVARQVPGLNFNRQFGSGGPEIYIRGVGARDVNINTTGAVGVYLDEVNLGVPLSQSLAIFDIERVEVLKGPQGTLYGKNTTGGAINFFSRKPDGTLNGFGRIVYGRFNEINVEAAIGLPIADGLSARISGITNNRDGYATNLVRPSDSKVGRREEYAVRGQLRYQADNVDLLLSARYAYADNDNPPGKFFGTANPNVPALPSEALGLPPGGLVRGFFVPCGCTTGVNIIGLAPAPQGDNEFTSTGRGFDKVRSRAVSLVGEFDLGSHSLTSVTGFEANSRRGLLDSGRAPVQVLNLTYDGDESRQWSQEVRLTSQAEGPLRYIVGGYYAHTVIRSNDGFDLLRQQPVTVTGLAGFGIPDGTPIIGGQFERRQYRQANPTWAVFGQATYKFTDTLAFTGGLRYTADTKRYRVLAFNEVIGNVVLPSPSTVIPVTNFRRRDTALSYRASLEFQPTPTMLFFASFNRGFKGGGFNGAATVPEELTAYDPETVSAFEGGAKIELFERRLRLNAAVYYYDYNNLQVFQLKGANTPSGIAQVYENATDATVKGFELEATARPFRGLTLTSGVSYIDGTYGTFVTNLGTYSGNRINNTPRWSINGTANYRWDISTNVEGYVQADYSWRTRIYFDSTQREEVSSGGSYGLLGARIGATFASDRYGLALFGRNLTDKRYVTNVIDISRTLGYLNYYLAEPRTYGIELNAKF